MALDPSRLSCPLPVLEHEAVLLGHGGGGVLGRELLEGLFLPAFRNPTLDALEDAARLPSPGGRLALTTDAFVVSPLFFPGGDIGHLAIHGTVNDLAVSGAVPRYLAASFILEEGLAMDELRRIVTSMRDAADAAAVQVVCGDTKVVGRGSGDGVFITTTGVGEIPDGVELSAAAARPGDAVLLSGSLGDHGIAILAAREGLGLEGALESDTAALHGLVASMLAVGPGIRAMRDATRGGLAAVLNEIALASQVGIEIDEARLPVRDAVRGACELLGFDPLHVANEGKLVAFVAAEQADAVLAAMRADPCGRDAVCIGHVAAEGAGRVTVRTGIGGSRVLDLPHGELLPRIC